MNIPSLDLSFLYQITKWFTGAFTALTQNGSGLNIPPAVLAVATPCLVLLILLAIKRGVLT